MIPTSPGKAPGEISAVKARHQDVFDLDIFLDAEISALAAVAGLTEAVPTEPRDDYASLDIRDSRKARPSSWV